MLLRVFPGILLLSSLCLAGDLYTIAPDNNNVPTLLLDVTLHSDLFMLGDDSMAFSGLTLNSATGTFFAVANDSFGNSYLDSFTLGGPGTLTQIAQLGTGFTSGMVFDPDNGNLYALDNDFSNTGNTYFDQVSPTGAVTQLANLGQGFEGFGTGGLTYDPTNGLFYAMGADSDGISRQFQSISLSGSVNLIASLGNGDVVYNGGIFFNPAFGSFDAISTDSGGNSQNVEVLTNGHLVTFDGAGIGQGITNVGLTGDVGVSSVPEPSSLSYAVIAAASFLLVRVKSRLPR